MDFVVDTTVFLAAAILVVPIFRRLGLGDVLGFLCAGLLIGPSGIGFVRDPDSVLHFAEIGVVFLLFVIGLELQPSRLWVFRHLMFGLGTLQLLLTNAIFAAIGRMVGLDWPAAIAIGGALALSSTAFVLQLMGERKELMLPHGRAAFGVLLLQDIAVIPLLALIEMLGDGDEFLFNMGQLLEVAELLVRFLALIIVGRYLLRYLLRFIASLRHSQLFLATALFILVGSGLVFEAVGLSMGLGAFTAGVLLADSEFRPQLEADILPFKGLLLGLFFIAVGMSANLALLLSDWPSVLFIVACLVVVKWIILVPLGYLFGLRETGPRRFGILLAQGGEFAFVLLTPALARGLVTEEIYDMLVLSVTLSMFCTPLLFLAESKWRKSRKHSGSDEPFDVIDADEPRIIIAGFGRVGQIIARVLHARGIPFVAMDANPDQVAFVRRYGNEVYYGDASRPDVLEMAGLADAEIFICAISDQEASLSLVEYLRRHYPDLEVYARARNRTHEIELRALGAKIAVRDTLHSSLQVAENVLLGLGFTSSDARETVKIFRQHDAKTLDQQFEVRDDEDAVFKEVMEATRQLKYLFEQDRK